ncbi:MAG: hypothetical protein ACE5QW_04835 [Thermoplasmata archaeon]
MTSRATDVEMITIPRRLYETLPETLEVLSDRAELESIRRGIEDIKKNRTYTEEGFLELCKHLLE